MLDSGIFDPKNKKQRARDPKQDSLLFSDSNTLMLKEDNKENESFMNLLDKVSRDHFWAFFDHFRSPFQPFEGLMVDLGV